MEKEFRRIATQYIFDNFDINMELDKLIEFFIRNYDKKKDDLLFIDGLKCIKSIGKMNILPLLNRLLFKVKNEDIIYYLSQTIASIKEKTIMKETEKESEGSKKEYKFSSLKWTWKMRIIHYFLCLSPGLIGSLIAVIFKDYNQETYKLFFLTIIMIPLGTFLVWYMEIKDMGLYRIARDEDILRRTIKSVQIDKRIILKIIQKGENEGIEFKSTLRWDIEKKEINKELEYVIAKTIASFLNSKGGILLIGINDSGKILGLENDYKTFSNDKQNRDGFYLKLIEIVKNMISPVYTQFIVCGFADFIDNKDLMCIYITPSNEPVFVTYKNKQDFIIRTGNGTQKILTQNEFTSYIKNRWKLIKKKENTYWKEERV